MKLPDKIIKLRKAKGWSQEDLAEKLDISRQAISRWENGTALPDVQNVLQISKLFNVTTDYLLNDDYESDRDIPVVQTTAQETEDLFQKKKRMHLISAIAFTIAVFFWLIGAVSSMSNIQLVFSVLRWHFVRQMRLLSLSCFLKNSKSVCTTIPIFRTVTAYGHLPPSS